ncbi:MAG: hypothetical protein ABSG25_10950 [Bryobacteraceae bacterium]
MDLYAIFTFAGLDFRMQYREAIRSAWDITADALRKTTVHPGGSVLRKAIRMNVVSFPAQIPVLLKQPPADMQWRMVLLYFVRGWSQPAIAARFGVPMHRIAKSLNEWSIRALALGYVQVIDPKAFASCCGVDVECGNNRGTEEIRLVEIGPPLMRPESRLLDSPDRSGDFVTALDVTIAHCEELRGDFWMRAVRILQDLRAAATALDLQGEQTEGLFELRAREEERVSHAVA